MIKISVFGLVNNTHCDVDAVIASLAEQTIPRQNFEIILIDNGAGHPPLDALADYPQIKRVKLPSFQGTTASFNAALSHAQGEIILLLQQDVTLDKNCLSTVVDIFAQQADIGMLSLNMISKDSHEEVQAPTNAACKVARLNKLGMVVSEMNSCQEGLCRTDVPPSRALAIRKEIIADLGGYLFDERLGSYLEEIDLTFRLRKTAWKLYTSASALALTDQVRKPSDKTRYRFGHFIHLAANRLLVFHNNFSKREFLLQIPLLLLGILLHSASYGHTSGLRFARGFLALALLPFVMVYFFLRVVASNEQDKQRIASGKGLPKRITWQGVVAISLILVLLLASIFYLKRTNLAQITDFARNTKYLALFLLLICCFYFVGALRFLVVFRQAGYKTRLFDIFTATVVGQVSALLTPLGSGQLILSPFLKQRYEIPLGASAVLIAVDRIFAFYMWFLLGMLGILGFWAGWLYALLSCLPVVAFCGWFFFYFVRLADDSIHQFGIPAYGGEVLHLLGHDLIVQITLHLLVITRFLIINLQYIVICTYLGWQIHFFDSWLVVSLSVLVGLLCMLPSGLVGEDVAIFSLSTIIGIPASISVAIMLLYRSLSTTINLLLGLVCGLWFGKLFTAGKGK